ncbi:Uncharacterized protein APZ42_022844 [Daphnia magna]|uniref:Uncharacterized protein n=1 Tax=Daphnia magna TaxID=35525 RepID=A0A164VU67_9CRUS|nr:Uncharacterized protein APZ42_022844 [Daphnia magna]
MAIERIHVDATPIDVDDLTGKMIVSRKNCVNEHVGKRDSKDRPQHQRLCFATYDSHLHLAQLSHGRITKFSDY